jgi:hypothetical protein
MAPCYQVRKIPPSGFAQYGSIAEWHLSAQRDRAPADLPSTAIVMNQLAKELHEKCLCVHCSMIANIAVLQKKSTTIFGRAEVC